MFLLHCRSSIFTALPGWHFVDFKIEYFLRIYCPMNILVLSSLISKSNSRAHAILLLFFQLLLDAIQAVTGLDQTLGVDRIEIKTEEECS